MIRIFTANDPMVVRVTVDGQLVDDYVDALNACMSQAMSQPGQVQLFLRDVSHIDERGRSLLAQLASTGVKLSASGVYSAYIVSEICREHPREPEAERGPRQP
jgi:hypothetical protein